MHYKTHRYLTPAEVLKGATWLTVLRKGGRLLSIQSFASETDADEFADDRIREREADESRWPFMAEDEWSVTVVEVDHHDYDAIDRAVIEDSYAEDGKPYGVLVDHLGNVAEAPEVPSARAVLELVREQAEYLKCEMDDTAIPALENMSAYVNGMLDLLPLIH